jgi:hypothetical protein
MKHRPYGSNYCRVSRDHAGIIVSKAKRYRRFLFGGLQFFVDDLRVLKKLKKCQGKTILRVLTVVVRYSTVTGEFLKGARYQAPQILIHA